MKPLYIDKSARKYHAFPLHQHAVWEITVNLAGSGTASIDGRDYPFGPGTIFCVAPGIRHCKVSEDGFIDGSLMLQDFIPPGGAQVYAFEDDARGSFQFLFSLMFDVLMTDGPNAQAVVHSLADSMYQLMLSWSATRNRNAAVEQFQKVLLEHLSDCGFDPAAQMRASGYSTSYFRKLFKLSTGESPVGYFNRLRVEYAKRQIQQYFGVRSLKEIAYSSGFEDPYYFSRVFRQYAGVNPQRYGLETSAARAEKISGEFLALR